MALARKFATALTSRDPAVVLYRSTPPLHQRLPRPRPRPRLPEFVFTNASVFQNRSTKKCSRLAVNPKLRAPRAAIESVRPGETLSPLNGHVGPSGDKDSKTPAHSLPSSLPSGAGAVAIFAFFANTKPAKAGPSQNTAARCLNSNRPRGQAQRALKEGAIPYGTVSLTDR